MAHYNSSDDERGDVKPTDAKPLTLRDFPKKLYWNCKEMAARREMSLKAYIIEALEEALKRDSKRTRPV